MVLCLLVIGLAYLAFRNTPQETPGKPSPAATSPAELWRTNVVERWRTNTETVTNVVVQPVTNEVVKEVPAKLSSAERDAAVLGFKYLHAPTLEDSADALYKVGPVAVEMYIDSGSATILGQNMDELRSRIETALQSRNVPVKEQSPHHLRVNISPRWRMSDPRVALVSCSVELQEPSAFQRQGDIVKRVGTVWTTSTSKFIRTINLADEVEKCLQEPIDRFCDDYHHAKEREKEIQSKIPTVPAAFPAGME